MPRADGDPHEEKPSRIEQYGLIGDVQTSAHVHAESSIDWLVPMA
ncbi:hypothetical protein DUI70_7002 [Streptomyces albus]|nr:hypothetical protein DUI70_7002 [Streptomyces albus]